MQPKNSLWVLSIFMAGAIGGCVAGRISAPPAEVAKPQAGAGAIPANTKETDRIVIGNGLVLTKVGIDFADHACTGAFTSRQYDEVIPLM